MAQVPKTKGRRQSIEQIFSCVPDDIGVAGTTLRSGLC
jgi:hypothetical protein